jgi:hypothetical protein
MQSVGRLIAALLLITPLAAGGSVSVKKGPSREFADFFEDCKNGLRGGGYNSTTGYYDWTCGNYNWSAIRGGTQVSAGDGSTISDYNSPTTVGGNSWTMICTGDGVADQTGAGSTTADATPVEETVCLHAGEQIRMYATADVMLAADNTKPGGKIYLPEGLYHLGYCGQQADGTTNNGCPVLQNSPTHYQRKVQMWGGRELVGSGQDPDGPHVNGRTGTWFILATGDDLDADGDVDDDICDRNDDGWCDNGTGGCALGTPSASSSTMKMGKWAKTFTGVVLDADIPLLPSTHSRVCLENTDLTTTGTCSGDRSVLCTANTGTRTSTTAGSCQVDDSSIGGGTVDLGTCEPLVDALVTDMAAQAATSTAFPGVHFKLTTFSPQHRGLGSELTSSTKLTALARVGAFESDGTILSPTLAPCVTTGAWVYLTAPTNGGGTTVYHHPSFLPVWDAGAQPTTSIWFPDWTKYNNEGGGYSHLNFMPAHWLGRNSTNDAADCDTFQANTGGAQDDGVANSACDALNLFVVGSTQRGHLLHVSTWYGGGDGAAHSLIDTSGGEYVEVGHSSFNSGNGMGSDSGAWWFHDNVWRDWDASPGTFMAWNFAPGARVEREKYINIDANWCFSQQLTTGLVVRDIEIISSQCNSGMFDLSGARSSLFSGIMGYGNRGPVWTIGPGTGADTWDVVAENVNLVGHTTISGGSSMEALIIRYDNDGDSNYLGNVDNVTFRDHHYSVAGTTDVCMIGLEGGSGDEVTVTNNDDEEHGDGRKVDDDRHQLSFENISLERVSKATVTSQTEFFCLGNSSAAEQSPSEAMSLVSNGIWGSRGGMPRFVGLSIDGQFFPDNPYRSVRAVDATLDARDDGNSGHINNAGDYITFTDHGLRDRDVVTYTQVAGSAPTGLTNGNVYYVIYRDENSIQLDDDRSIATAISLTGQTSGTHTFTLTTGLEPDCDDLVSGTEIRTHSATSDGDCTDADADGLLDGGGDFNAVCTCL